MGPDAWTFVARHFRKVRAHGREPAGWRHCALLLDDYMPHCTSCSLVVPTPEVWKTI